MSLNESPSEKEGKFVGLANRRVEHLDASMKALPKRKGNLSPRRTTRSINLCLNESPSEKEGKYKANNGQNNVGLGLNESPSEKEGKCA